MSRMTSGSSRDAVSADLAHGVDIAGPPSLLWSDGHLEALVDRRLRLVVPPQSTPPQLLHLAMSYSALAPGKRLRPLLTLHTALHLGRRDLAALDCACAVELVHAASLIIDDLPCMDDAALRRGQPTAHRKFGEDIAILSGVALLNLAYAVIAASDSVPAAARIEAVGVLAHAVGSEGLIGGQVLDLRARGPGIGAGELERLNRAKTGALIVAAADLGALVAGAGDESRALVRRFAEELGQAFQIADDVLDGAAYAGKTGKDTGKDAAKPTLAGVLGSDGARHRFEEHVARCREALGELGATDRPLGRLVERCLGHVRI